jgi:DNA repair photolyase
MKKKLNPVEYKKASITVSLLNLNFPRIKTPGRKVRYKKPKIILKNGISIPIRFKPIIPKRDN